MRTNALLKVAICIYQDRIAQLEQSSIDPSVDSRSFSTQTQNEFDAYVEHARLVTQNGKLKCKNLRQITRLDLSPKYSVEEHIRIDN